MRRNSTAAEAALTTNLPRCDDCGHPHVTRYGHPSCTAHRKGKRTGGVRLPCPLAPMKGHHVCHLHGGKSRIGPAAANWQHGGYSRLRKLLPERYHEALHESFGDPDYVSLRDELALLKVRRDELLARLAGGESGASWRAARAEVDAVLERYAEDGELDLTHLLRIIHRGLGDEAQWREALDVFEARRKLSDTERRKIESSRAALTAEEVAMVGGYFAGMLKRYILDARPPEVKLRAAHAEMQGFFRDWKPEDAADAASSDAASEDAATATSDAPIDAEVIDE